MRFLFKPISVHTLLRCTAEVNDTTEQNSSFPKIEELRAMEDSSRSSYREIQGGLFLLLPSGNLKTETE